MRYFPLDEHYEEHRRVHHHMMTALNVWKKSLSPEAANAVHFGVTTVDVYDTVLAMQMRSSLRRQLRGEREADPDWMQKYASWSG